MSVPPTSIFWPGLPNLLDLADGTTLYPPFGASGSTPTPSITVGTPNPSGAITVKAANGAVVINGIQIEELTDSPELERAEQATSTKRFKMSYATGVFLINYLGRGTILQDNEGRTVRILSTNIKRERPNMCVFTIVSEGLSFDTPPDEFDIEPVELGADILKYPRYFYSLLPQPGDSVAQQQVKQAVTRAVQTYRDSPFFPPGNGNALNGLLQGQLHSNIASQFANGTFVITIPNINFKPQFKVTPDFNGNTPSYPIQTYGAVTYPAAATADGQLNTVNVLVSVNGPASNDTVVQAAYAAASEIINKLWRQEDSPYIVALQMQWSAYYYIKPFYNAGGYIEIPFESSVANPGLPAYFGSPSFDYNTDNIFDQLALYNPQCYSSNGNVDGSTQISWLRKADVVNYQRTWFKVTRTWLGSPSAHWDADLYNQNPRPGITNYSSYPWGYNVLV